MIGELTREMTIRIYTVQNMTEYGHYSEKSNLTSFSVTFVLFFLCVLCLVLSIEFVYDNYGNGLIGFYSNNTFYYYMSSQSIQFRYHYINRLQKGSTG